MYSEHPSIITPGDQVNIWRYMDFSKLIGTLENGALYFRRVDQLGDPFEGSLPQKHKLGYFAGTIEEREEKVRELEGKGPLTEKSRQALLEYSMANHFRMFVYVNCWHINKYDSDAMWKVYQKSDAGIAIQSTVGRVKKSLKSSDVGVTIGKINYIDYDKTEFFDINLFAFSHIKRKCFEHEKELRLAITHTPKEAFSNPEDYRECKSLKIVNSYGIYVKVDLDKLISRIYISPTSQDWVLELVKAIINRYGFKMPVDKSEIFKMPLF